MQGILAHFSLIPQSVNAKGHLSGTCLRFVAVNHNGNQNESIEGVETTAKLVSEFLDAESTWTNRKAKVLKPTLNDILVVTPYSQVSALCNALLLRQPVGLITR